MTSESVLFNETHTCIKQANKRNYKLRTRDQNHITIYSVFLDEVQLDLQIQTRLYQNPCYFELKTLSHGFAFQTFPISYFKLPLFQTILGFPHKSKIVGLNCTVYYIYITGVYSLWNDFLMNNLKFSNQFIVQKIKSTKKLKVPALCWLVCTVIGEHYWAELHLIIMALLCQACKTGTIHLIPKWPLF